jgi:hypothetical protein
MLNLGVSNAGRRLVVTELPEAQLSLQTRLCVIAGYDEAVASVLSLYPDVGSVADRLEKRESRDS